MSTKKTFVITAAICTACDLPISTPQWQTGCERNHRKIGTFTIEKTDNFAQIIAKLNKHLLFKRMPPVQAFHYLQEDADLNYASAQTFNHEDLLESLQFSQLFFVYFDDTC